MKEILDDLNAKKLAFVRMKTKLEEIQKSQDDLLKKKRDSKLLFYFFFIFVFFFFTFFVFKDEFKKKAANKFEEVRIYVKIFKMKNFEKKI